MADVIPPSPRALAEALDLSTEILRNLELSEIPLTNIALKASRLARLLNEFDSQKIMTYEAGGYPSAADGLSSTVWALVASAGRTWVYLDPKSKEMKAAAYLEPIGQLEEELRSAEVSIAAARDPDRATASPSPYVGFQLAQGNQLERGEIRQRLQTAAERLASRRTFIYTYVLRKHYELKFSRIAGDVFARIREHVDATIGGTIPAAIQRLSAVYENLDSENPEDWSNAVHSCRRILEELADAVFPPTDEVRKAAENGGDNKAIRLAQGNYINRLMCFIEDTSSSDRFTEIVGSHLRYIGERLDSVVAATQKGSHRTIVRRDEADRYVVYTYLIVGDILSLAKPKTPAPGLGPQASSAQPQEQ